MSNSDYTGQPSQLEQQAQAAASGSQYDPQQDAERIVEDLQTRQPRYMPAAQLVDTTLLAKAQGSFIGRQTEFFMTPHRDGSQEYNDSLRRYSGAQNQYIQALQLALHQVGVL